MNILHGDSAAGSFRTAFQYSREEMLIFRDVLSCGPVPYYHNIKRWRESRYSFWNGVCLNNCVEMQTFVNDPRDFYENFSAFESATEIKLWIGTGLSDQLLLAFIVYLFDVLNLDFERLSIYQFEQISGKDKLKHPIQGLGLLKPEQIKEHPSSYRMQKEQIMYAHSAWEAFTSPDPRQYLEFMAINSGVLPLLHRAMSSLIFRYPQYDTGLSYWDQKLLKNIRDHGPKATKIVGFTLTDGMEGLDLVGDWYLFSRLKNLAKSKVSKPLILLNDHNRTMRDTEAQITEFGKHILGKKANVLEEDGINDWIGGVNLRIVNNSIWVRENNELLHVEISLPETGGQG